MAFQMGGMKSERLAFIWSLSIIDFSWYTGTLVVYLVYGLKAAKTWRLFASSANAVMIYDY